MNPLYVKVSFPKLLFRMVIALNIFLRSDILSHYWCLEILKCKTFLGSFIFFSPHRLWFSNLLPRVKRGDVLGQMSFYLPSSIHLQTFNPKSPMGSSQAVFA